MSTTAVPEDADGERPTIVDLIFYRRKRHRTQILASKITNNLQRVVQRRYPCIAWFDSGGGRVAAIG
jgi:hypothetical protein